MKNCLITLQYALPKSPGFPTKPQFKLWLTTTLKSLAYTNSVECTIRLVDTQESATLNSQYRHKTGPTNVLSFPFENLLESEENYLGDLVICAPLVAQEATEQNKPPLHHWAHLTVHGVLHLLGYDHEEEAEAEKMEALEIKILSQLGIGDPY